MKHTTKPVIEAPADELAKIHKLATVLDRQFKLPGGVHIGLDGMIGLIPGAGDLIGGALSAYLIFKAHHLKLPKWKLAKMVMHTSIDSILGMIPLFGDIFDLCYKANVKNAKIIASHLEQQIQINKIK